MNRGIYLSLSTGLVQPRPVSSDLIEALSEVQVITSTEQQSGFQLRFRLGRSSAVRRRLENGELDPRTRVVVSVTVNGVVQVLVDGIITKQDLTAGTDSTLTLTGLDLTELMDLIDLSDIPYPAVPPEGRVLMMLAKYAPLGIRPRVIPTTIPNVYSPLDLICKQRGTDLQYITHLAREAGFVFYLEAGPRPGQSLAYFGPEIRLGQPQSPLTIDMDAATNIESLSFSYDGLARTQLVGVAFSEKLGIPIPIPIPNLSPVKPTLATSAAKSLKARFSCLGHLSAAGVAQLLLGNTANTADAVTASGELDVARYGNVLLPRKLVAVRGAGEAFNGLYFVKSVTHTLRAGSYRQSFSLARGGVGSTISKVSA